MKDKKGITLVALVVTIIILIILAGVSINLVLGDNGIITIAKKAKENIELAKIEEETKLNELYIQLENNSGSSEDTNYDEIVKLTEFTILTLVTAGNGSPGGADITLNTKNYSNLTIDSISFAAYVLDSEVIIYGDDKSKTLYQLIDTNRYDFRGKTYNNISIDVSDCNNISIYSFANATDTTGREITYKNITLK